MRLKMLKGLFGLVLTAILSVGCSSASAQSTATPVLPGVLVNTGCPAGQAYCWQPYSLTNPLPVTGGGGGGGGAVFGPTAVGTAAANPPVLTGGTLDGTATGSVQVWKIISGVGQVAVPAGVSITGGSVGLLSGTQIVGKFGIDQTTPGMTNGVQINSSVLPTGGATSANQATAISDLAAIATSTAATATNTSNTNSVGVTQCAAANAACTASIVGNISTSATGPVQLVALAASKVIYVTNLSFNVDSTASGPDTVSITAGTGTACATGTVTLWGPSVIAAGSGNAFITTQTPSGDALCINKTAAVHVGGGYVVQQQ